MIRRLSEVVSDPGERNNPAGENEDVAAKLKRVADDARADPGDDYTKT